MCPVLPRNEEHGLRDVITPFTVHLLFCNWNVTLSLVGSSVKKNVDEKEQLKEQALLSLALG